MAEDPRGRKRLIVLVVLVLIIIAIILLLTRCLPQKPAAPVRDSRTPPPTQPGGQATNPPDSKLPDEVLTPATLAVPQKVAAGSAFAVDWTGPDNHADYVVIVPVGAAADARGNFQETAHSKPKDAGPGKILSLTAPMTPGAHEVRYVTARSHTILAKAAIEVEAVSATLDAPAEVVLGSPFSVTWTGPNNMGDYITVVPKDAPDGKYESYADTAKGSPSKLTAPTTTGDVELRYVTKQDTKVLVRRPLKIIGASVTLSAPDNAVAGTTIEVKWTGPNNTGDYITVVESKTPDGQYASYSNTSQGSPLKLLLPILDADAELRYMTGQGNKVLARRPIRVAAAIISLTAPPKCAPGAEVTITWTGPNNPGDYITIVTKDTNDGQYAAYANTSTGSPVKVKAPTQAGEAEIRYAAGQGNKVLARIAITVAP